MTRPGSSRLVALALLAVGCVGASTVPPPVPPLTHDPDRRPFRAELEPYWSPPEWDHLDKSFFYPVSRFFAVEPGGEATNVNALDEVPSSSWFENRIEKLDSAGMARGPCAANSEIPAPWRIVSSKPDGVYPGFVIQDAQGQRHLIKLDGGLQGPHGSAADVVGSRLYFAAGFDVPCNTVVHFERSRLTLAADATVERSNGDEAALTWSDVDQSLARALRLPDGRYRALASRYLSGRPLGPWRYEGTREGDRNDIIPHQDRRELRGSRLLAAWTGHWDAREQNTLSMWLETSPGRGFVRHHLLDFGDCFGAFAGPSAEHIKRRGQVHWFDPGQILGDFASLGAVERPWDRSQLGPSGAVFGFYDIDQFEPESWSPSYPNPAFGRMTERDAAWMARIIARFGTPELRAMVGNAGLDESLERELVRLLRGRQRKILERYLTRLSPLGRPKLERDPAGTWLCADDLAAVASLARHRVYWANALPAAGEPTKALRVRFSEAKGQVCALLPTWQRAAAWPLYFAVELGTQKARGLPYPARLHLYQLAAERYLIVGLERMAD